MPDGFSAEFYQNFKEEQGLQDSENSLPGLDLTLVSGICLEKESPFH